MNSLFHKIFWVWVVVFSLPLHAEGYVRNHQILRSNEPEDAVFSGLPRPLRGLAMTPSLSLRATRSNPGAFSREGYKHDQLGVLNSSEPHCSACSSKDNLRHTMMTTMKRKY
jgi:hypothetical protein